MKKKEMEDFFQLIPKKLCLGDWCRYTRHFSSGFRCATALSIWCGLDGPRTSGYRFRCSSSCLFSPQTHRHWYKVRVFLDVPSSKSTASFFLLLKRLLHSAYSTSVCRLASFAGRSTLPVTNNSNSKGTEKLDLRSDSDDLHKKAKKLSMNKKQRSYRNASRPL